MSLRHDDVREACLHGPAKPDTTEDLDLARARDPGICFGLPVGSVSIGGVSVGLSRTLDAWFNDGASSRRTSFAFTSSRSPRYTG